MMLKLQSAIHSKVLLQASFLSKENQLNVYIIRPCNLACIVIQVLFLVGDKIIHKNEDIYVFLE